VSQIDILPGVLGPWPVPASEMAKSAPAGKKNMPDGTVCLQPGGKA